MDISILICTHNRAPELDVTLTSLSRLKIPEGVAAEIIVVMNGCIDDTASVVADRVDGMPLPLRAVDEPNLGLSHARNRALAEARGERLAFLDDDVKVAPGWLAGLLATFRNFGVDIVAGRTLLWWRDCMQPEWWSDHLIWVLSGYDRGESDHVLLRPTAVGANFAFHRRVSETIGEFDPGLGRSGTKLTAGEESDFLLRAEEAGFRAAYGANAKVEHLVPVGRLTEAYFCGVAQNHGRAYYALHPRSGLRRFATIGYHAACWLRHALLARFSPERSPSSFYHQLKAAGSRGSIDRLVSRYR